MDRISKLLAMIVIAVSTTLFSAIPISEGIVAGRIATGRLTSKQFEEHIFGQLFAIAEQRADYKSDAETLEERKAALENMSMGTKERVLEELATMMLEEGEHPFLAPPGTDYSQLDMFFLLSITLMSHNKELCDGLTRCVGEKALYKLKTHLEKVLSQVSQSTREKLTPKTPKAQLDFVRKMKSRIGTKAKEAKEVSNLTNPIFNLDLQNKHILCLEGFGVPQLSSL